MASHTESTEIDNADYDEFEGMDLPEIRAELRAKGMDEQKIKKIISRIDSLRIQKIYSEQIAKKGREYLLAGYILLFGSTAFFFFLYLLGSTGVFSIIIVATAGSGYFMVQRGKTILSGKNRDFHSHIRNSFNDIDRL